jgi:hypothetical protein
MICLDSLALLLYDDDERRLVMVCSESACRSSRSLVLFRQGFGGKMAYWVFENALKIRWNYIILRYSVFV